MKHLQLAIILLSGFITNAQTQITRDYLQSNLDKEVNLCGNVTQTIITKKGVTYLNIDDIYPDNVFSVVIFKKDLVNFKHPIKQYYEDSSICVEGKLTKYNDRFQIIANDNLQLEIIKGE